MVQKIEQKGSPQAIYLSAKDIPLKSFALNTLMKSRKPIYRKEAEKGNACLEILLQYAQSKCDTYYEH